MRSAILIFLFLLLAANTAVSQRIYLVQGIVLEEDSSTTVPFAYVINTRTGNGCVSDFNGKFSITGENRDTIEFTFVGYAKKKVLVGVIKNTSDSTKQNLRVVLHKTVYTLDGFSVTAFKIKPYEREYMQRVINRPRPTGIEAFQSPITALYENFSHKGRANRKLAAIFEQIFIDEQVDQKFNAEILRRLTGDETVDFERFRKYCYSVTDDFILSHEGYDLYEAIMACYRRWKKEGR
ncbi:MAG: carboxypeptidase-like regulatory domain-containing protein [Bacteroidia bacterium]